MLKTKPQPRNGVTHELALRLGRLAGAIRRRLHALRHDESSYGPLHEVHTALRLSLFPNLSDDEFADIYAQTVACGLMSESLLHLESQRAAASGATPPVDSRQTILREFLRMLPDGCGAFESAEAGVGVLQRPHVSPRMRGGDSMLREDPVVHFYETFLKQYDPKQRMRRGVFYTPRPVVSFIVRRVDNLLRDEFGLADGLADSSTWGEIARRHPGLNLPAQAHADDPFVRILDPAMGTGTFLAEVIEVVHQTLSNRWQTEGHSDSDSSALWNEYVPRHLLPRLFGFELMPAPYTIAQLKIALKLRETGYELRAGDPLNIHWTNTLEGPRDAGREWERLSPALALAARDADRVKSSVPFTVVIGNPPYSGISTNGNPWIEGLLKGRLPGGLPERSYYEVDGRPLGEKKLWLQDDYVKFIRYAQWQIDRARCGVVGYLSNHSFLDNPTFRGMRQQLLATFPRITALDLHGSQKRRRSSEGPADGSVFDIAQGVAISFLRSAPSHRGPPQVEYAQLTGTREAKYQRLDGPASSEIPATHVDPHTPHYFFVPRDESHRVEYEAGWKVTDVFPVYTSGIVTARDAFVVDFDRESLLQRIAEFREASISDDELRQRHFLGKGSAKYIAGDSRGWKLADARARVQSDRQWRERIATCLYRPFDLRPLYYVPWMVDWPRPRVMRHFDVPGNLGLITCRQQSQQNQPWSHVGVTDRIVESCALSNKTREIGSVFPLYLAEGPPVETAATLFRTEARDQRPRLCNLTPEFIAAVSAIIGLKWSDEAAGDLTRTFGPADLFHLIYAQWHSTAFRRRYAAFLRIDFPRVFVPRSAELFRELCRLGAALVKLQLPREGSFPATDAGDGIAGVEFFGAGPAEVARGFPRFSSGTVPINPRQGFEGVSEAIWDFHVGSYRVCEKWLKDRRGRILRADEIAHYRNIVAALSETLRLTTEIDTAIESQGGWPTAFRVD